MKNGFPIADIPATFVSVEFRFSKNILLVFVTLLTSQWPISPLNKVSHEISSDELSPPQIRMSLELKLVVLTVGVPARL
jgi:hypothetical protein